MMNLELSAYSLSETKSSMEIAIKKEELINKHIEIEKRVLGYMLMSDEIAIIGCKTLFKGYFSHPIHEYIFEVVKHYIDKNENVEKAQTALISITDTDWKKIIPAQIFEGKQYLRNLSLINLDFAHKSLADQLFETVKDQYIQRQIINDHTQRINTILLTTSLSRSTTDLLKDISQNVETMLDCVGDENEMQDVADIINEMLHEVQLPKISSGYVYLDKIIGGFTPTNLVTIGGAPGSGKSAFALNIALNMCKNGVKVAFWSFEMNKQEISARILAIRSSLNFSDNIIIDEEHYNAGRKYLDNIQDQLKISTYAVHNIDTFYLKCRYLKNKWGLQVVFIDYLQLIHLYQDFGNNRVKEITHITNRLKAFAQDLGITIIILSQFSKEITKRADDTPCLADLKDSSSIEQDSNVVILLHKPSKPKDNPLHFDDSLINVIVAKNRSGVTKSIVMKYIGNLTKFIE